MGMLRPLRDYRWREGNPSSKLLGTRLALPPLTREECANRAKLAISTHLNDKQQAFLDVVLAKQSPVVVICGAVQSGSFITRQPWPPETLHLCPTCPTAARRVPQ